MKVKFYGVRGSLPVCGRAFERYGGNTTCIRILREQANRLAIIDAGTGIRNLGKEIIKDNVSQNIINILFSHFHWDHIQGFPFFAPAYDKNQKIGIMTMGSKKKIKSLKQIFSLQMQKEFFPIRLDAMGADFKFFTHGGREKIYGAQVTAVPQYHLYPGGSYGFRIDDEGVSLVICTDVEHIHGIDQHIVNLARGADLLIHDGQYTAKEYRKFKGWGHSSVNQAAKVAKQAKVKQLIITHHDPDHDDAFLDGMEKECQSLFPNSLFAKEGMEVSVG